MKKAAKPSALLFLLLFSLSLLIGCEQREEQSREPEHREFYSLSPAPSPTPFTSLLPESERFFTSKQRERLPDPKKSRNTPSPSVLSSPAASAEPAASPESTAASEPAASLEPTASPEETVSPESAIVYWTPSGKKYHSTDRCRTLKRSKQILSGTLSEAKSSGHSEPCKVCN